MSFRGVIGRLGRRDHSRWLAFVAATVQIEEVELSHPVSRVDITLERGEESHGICPFLENFYPPTI